MNEHVVINSDKTMEIPEWLKDWLVQFDHKTTTITFDCPRYWRGIDLLEYAIYVSVIKKGKEPHTDLCENVCADENNSEMIHFDWKPTKAALSEKGELSFLICARITEDETIEGAWHTKICRMIKVAEGHECQIIDEEQYEDIITELVLQMKAISEQLANGGGGGTPNAVQYVPQELTEEQQEVARGNIGAASAAELSKVQEEILNLKQNTPSSESVLTIAQVEALDDMFKKCAFISNATTEYEAFKTAFGITDSGEEEPDTPDEPTTPTLESISATYTGGDVAVGTALTDLTGIAVTGHYSDGSTTAVIGYTLSGEIVEGENTITVSYGGKTTTFTVTGVAESGGIVNMFDKDTMVITGAYVGANGAIVTSATSKYAKIPISVGTYAIQKGSGWAMNTTGHPTLINANGENLCVIGNLQVNGSGGSALTPSVATVVEANGNNGIAVTVLSEEVTHIIFSICVNGGTDDTDTTMMETGDTCHDYVSYKGV